MKTKFSILERLVGDDHMTTLMLDEEGTDFEIEYASAEEYNKKMDHARVKMNTFLSITPK